MKNSGWVKWKHWTANGLVAFGQMPKRDVGRELQKFEVEAANVLKKTGADHVLYGVKAYDGHRFAQSLGNAEMKWKHSEDEYFDFVLTSLREDGYDIEAIEDYEVFDMGV